MWSKTCFAFGVSFSRKKVIYLALILDAKDYETAQSIKEYASLHVKTLNKRPRLTILAGGDSYDQDIALLTKDCQETGCMCTVVRFDKNTATEKIIEAIIKLKNLGTDGFTVLPTLPGNHTKIYNTIGADFDTTGLHPELVGKYMTEHDTPLLSPVARAVTRFTGADMSLGWNPNVLLLADTYETKAGLLATHLLRDKHTVIVSGMNTDTQFLKTHIEHAGIIISMLDDSKALTEFSECFDSIDITDAILIDAGSCLNDEGHVMSSFPIPWIENASTTLVPAEHIRAIARAITLRNLIQLCIRKEKHL